MPTSSIIESIRPPGQLRKAVALSILIGKPTNYRGSRVYVEMRNCNKPGCTRCPHGPYVYLLSGRIRRYLGPASVFS